LAMLSSMHGTGASKNYLRLLLGNVLLVFFATAGMAGAVIGGSRWIMGAYGPEFAKAQPVLILLVLTAVLSSTAGVIGQAIASAGEMWWGFTLNCFWASVLLVTSPFLIARYAALGLAESVLVAYVAHTLTVGAYAILLIARKGGTVVSASVGRPARFSPIE